MVRRTLKLFLALLISTSYLKSQTFEEFLTRLNSLPENERQVLVDSFLIATPSIPFTEDTIAHFIYSGDGTDLSVPGDFNAWNPENAPMKNIAGTNFWYRTEVFENHARLEYKLFYNGNWILDPRNPLSVSGGFGDNSELRMPGYDPPVEIKYYPSMPHGTLEDTVFFSTNLNNSRKIRVYLPPGYYHSTDEYPVVLMHDGLEFISFAKMNNVIDYLISENLIQPVIAIFVPPVQRTAECIDTNQLAYTNFITQELMPWVDNKYRISSDPALRAVMGASAGGNISLWLGMTHPETFGKIAAFSSYIEDDIKRFFENSTHLNLSIYMNLGTYDLEIIKQCTKDFIPVLQRKSYDYQFEEYPEGHNFSFWRAHLDDALIMFFASE